MPRLAKNRTEFLPNLCVWSAATLVVVVFGWIVGDLLWRGASVVSWEFLTEVPKRAGKAGGIAPILVSTGLLLAVCLAAVLPIGVGTAILLAEFRTGRSIAGRLVRGSLDVLAGVPSIVFGLFGNVVFCQILGMGYSILSGGLTLACMALPLLIRTAEVGLRAVPSEQRLAAAALGFSKFSTLGRVVLPAAAPAIAVGLVLSIGRALAETAALLFTSGLVDRMPESVWDSGRSLSVHIYQMSMNVAGGDRSAYGAAVVLVSLLLAINQLAAGTVRRFARQEIAH